MIDGVIYPSRVVNIYGPDRDASENLRMRIHNIAFYVGPTTIRGMGSRGDRVGGLTVKEPFNVTDLRFSPTSLSDPSIE